MDCIAGGLSAKVLHQAERAWQWSIYRWQSLYLILFVSVVVSVLVGVQLRTEGRVHPEAPAWFPVAGLYAMLSVYKDAWGLKFPYCLFVVPAHIVGWVLRWLSQQASARPAVWAVAATVGTVLGGGITLVGVAAFCIWVFGDQLSRHQIDVPDLMVVPP